MIHAFETDIAKDVGVIPAILFNNILHWIKKNEANGKNFYDGAYWTYNSNKAFQVLFDYLTAKQIRLAIDKLCEAGYIAKGNYNTDQRDRTLWFRLAGKGKAICTEIHTPCKICTGDAQMHLPEKANEYAETGANAFAEKGKCIIGTDCKLTDITDGKQIQGARASAAPPPAADAGGLVCVLKTRINKLFNRRDTTAWSPKETTRLKEISKRPGVLEELGEIEKLYNSGYQYRRRDIITFLNNFTTELDRSRSQAPKKYDPYDTYGGHFSMDYDKEVGSSIPRTVPGGPMNF